MGIWVAIDCDLGLILVFHAVAGARANGTPSRSSRALHLRFLEIPEQALIECEYFA
jgi:hypothetical protein